MVRSVEPEDAAAFWEARYEQGLLYGTEPTFVAGDLLAADLPPESFDAAVAVHLIHLQPEPGRRAMVNRLWSLTRDGGLIAMTNFSTNEAGFATRETHAEPNTRIDPS